LPEFPYFINGKIKYIFFYHQELFLFLTRFWNSNADAIPVSLENSGLADTIKKFI